MKCYKNLGRYTVLAVKANDIMEGLEVLSKRVTEALTEGYKVTGGVSILDVDGGYVVAQAVIMDDTSPSATLSEIDIRDYGHSEQVLILPAQVRGHGEDKVVLSEQHLAKATEDEDFSDVEKFHNSNF